MSSNIDPAKLKVADLRNELSARGLDIKGTKPVLVKRLKDALEKELEQDLPDTSIVDTSTDDVEEAVSPRKSLRGSVDDKEEQKQGKSAPVVSHEEAKPKAALKSPEKRTPNAAITPEKPQPTATKVPEQPKPVVKPRSESKVSEKVVDKSEVKSPEKVAEKSDTKSPDKLEVQEEKKEHRESRSPKHLKQENGEQEEKMDVQEEQKDQENKTESDSEQKGEKRKRSGESPERVQKRARTPPREDEPEISPDTVQLSWYDSDLHLQIDRKTFLSAKPLIDGAFGFVWSGTRATHGVSTGKVCFEVKITEKLKWEEFPNRDRYRTENRRGRRDDHTRSRKDSSVDDKPKTESENPTEESEKTNDESEKKDENSENAETKDELTAKDESTDTPSDDKKDKSEAKTDETKTAEPMETSESDDKKIEEGAEKKDSNEEKDNEKENKKEEPAPLPTHFIRVGWSVPSATLQLGEGKHSYAYESSGKFVKEKEFSDYGITFDAGDVVGVYLDISATTVSFQFTVNDQVQPSLEVPISELPQDFVLFPHILSRNYAFELNFGDKEEPWFPIHSELAGYQYISKVDEKIAGPTRPEQRSECEVLMMFGLPGSGKSHWINEHVESNVDKNYTILGSLNLLDRMTMYGEPLKTKYTGKWAILIDRLQKCLNRLVSIASFRRRNYIIDQSNVYPSAQRRKLRPFEGFKRKAVVVVNEDEEQARRQALQEAVEGKEVPDSTILEMKAAMALPEKCDWIDEVVYAAEDEEKAKEIVKKYQEAGKAAGYGSEKRFNRDRWGQRRNNYRGGRNFQRHGGGGYGQQPYPQARWSGPPRHGGGGGGWKQDPRSRDWRGGGGGYNRERDYYNQGGYSNRNQSYGGGRSQGGGGQRWGGSGWSGGGGQGGGWNQQNFGRNYNNWGNQGQGSWGGKYGSSGSGNGSQGYGGGQGYAGGGNWNYYGQQGQNWSGQGQQQSYQQQSQAGAFTAQGQQSGAYSTQEAWAQYAKQYAQHQQMAQAAQQKK